MPQRVPRHLGHEVTRDRAEDRRHRRDAQGRPDQLRRQHEGGAGHTVETDRDEREEQQGAGEEVGVRR
jgi:hypothetical protein